MSKKKGKRKSDKNKNPNTLEKIVLITALLNLICEVIEIIKKLT